MDKLNIKYSEEKRLWIPRGVETKGNKVIDRNKELVLILGFCFLIAVLVKSYADSQLRYEDSYFRSKQEVQCPEQL